jgi:hypothetical protein
VYNMAMDTPILCVCIPFVSFDAATFSCEEDGTTKL